MFWHEVDHSQPNHGDAGQGGYFCSECETKRMNSWPNGCAHCGNRGEVNCLIHQQAWIDRLDPDGTLYD